MSDDAKSPPASEKDTPGSADLAPTGGAAAAVAYRPNYAFLAIVTVVTLVLDLGSKFWAKAKLYDVGPLGERRIEVIRDHLGFSYAKNRGGAWGILQDEPEAVRRYFFLGISILAIVFIVSLYRKLVPGQTALKWGLPLVLGGALGNLVNRIQYQYVIDFIDFRAGWVRWVNGLFSKYPSDHWPTFNVADIAIVVGVGLMAIDMFTSRKPKSPAPAEPASAGPASIEKAPPASSPAPSSEAATGEPGPVKGEGEGVAGDAKA